MEEDLYQDSDPIVPKKLRDWVGKRRAWEEYGKKNKSKAERKAQDDEESKLFFEALGLTPYYIRIQEKRQTRIEMLACAEIRRKRRMQKSCMLDLSSPIACAKKREFRGLVQRRESLNADVKQRYDKEYEWKRAKEERGDFHA